MPEGNRGAGEAPTESHAVEDSPTSAEDRHSPADDQPTSDGDRPTTDEDAVRKERLERALRKYRATLRNEAESGTEGFSAEHYRSQKPPHW